MTAKTSYPPAFPPGCVAFDLFHQVLATVISWDDQRRAKLSRWPDGTALAAQVNEEELISISVFTAWAQDQEWWGQPDSIPSEDWYTRLLYLVALAALRPNHVTGEKEFVWT